LLKSESYFLSTYLFTEDFDDVELLVKGRISFLLGVAASEVVGATEALDINVTAINTMATTMRTREPRRRMPFFFMYFVSL
jgi:hypothetical protein